MKYSKTLFMVFTVTLLCGCSRSVSFLDERDMADSRMKRALEKSNAGDVDGAIKLYRKVLNNESREARAHLDLALLLSEKKDYLDAICHFKRYLAMRPDTEKRDMIEKRLQRDIQLFVASQIPDSSLRTVKSKGTNDDKFATTLKKLKQAEIQEQELRDYISGLKKVNKDLERKLASSEAELEQYRAVVGLVSQPARQGIKHPKSEVTKETKEKTETKPRTYRVRRGDTLSSIAQDVYGDDKLWVKILKANRKQLKGSQKIKVGQVLIIP